MAHPGKLKPGTTLSITELTNFALSHFPNDFLALPPTSGLLFLPQSLDSNFVEKRLYIGENVFKDKTTAPLWAIMKKDTDQVWFRYGTNIVRDIDARSNFSLAGPFRHLPTGVTRQHFPCLETIITYYFMKDGLVKEFKQGRKGTVNVESFAKACGLVRVGMDKDNKESPALEKDDELHHNAKNISSRKRKHEALGEVQEKIDANRYAVATNDTELAAPKNKAISNPQQPSISSTREKLAQKVLNTPGEQLIFQKSRVFEKECGRYEDDLSKLTAEVRQLKRERDGANSKHKDTVKMLHNVLVSGVDLSRAERMTVWKYLESEEYGD